MSATPPHYADLPEPLRDPALLATIRALDAQYATEKRRGNWSLVFDYDDQGRRTGARIVAPTMYFPSPP